MNNVKDLINKAEELCLQAAELEIGTSELRILELRNIRCALKGAIYNLQFFGTIETEDEDIPILAERIKAMEDDLEFAGLHQHLLDK